MDITFFLVALVFITILFTVGFMVFLTKRVSELLTTRFTAFTTHLDVFINEIAQSLSSTNTTVNKLVETALQRVDTTDSVSHLLIEAQLKIADLERDRQALLDENRQLMLQANEDVELAAPDNDTEVLDLDDMFETLLSQLDKQESVYEVGVYNGIVAVANTLSSVEYAPIQLAQEALQHKAATVTLPQRDAKGRFLPYATRKAFEQGD